MFLEDLLELEAQVRVEKMAAMGRISAAVAHEIRNPLAAISQANALLNEDLLDAGQKLGAGELIDPVKLTAGRKRHALVVLD